jgi:hypothetical protein
LDVGNEVDAVEGADMTDDRLEREAFEAWALDTKQAYRQNGFVIFYNTPAASLAWAGWKARASAMAPTGEPK